MDFPLNITAYTLHIHSHGNMQQNENNYYHILPKTEKNLNEVSTSNVN